MEVRNHFTHLALAGGLAAALALGGMTAAVPQSYADDSTGSATSSVTADATAATGSITINTNKNLSADNTTLSGYQIFKADVADKTVGTVTTKAVSNIEWASDAVQTVVVNSIKAVDSSYTVTTAQGAATWLSEHASGSGSSTVVDATDAFGKIAKRPSCLRREGNDGNPGTAATSAALLLAVRDQRSDDGQRDQSGGHGSDLRGSRRKRGYGQPKVEPAYGEQVHQERRHGFELGQVRRFRNRSEH